MVADGHLDEANKNNLRKTLFLPHIHQYQKEFRNELDVGKAKESNCFKSEPKEGLTESEFKSNVG